MTAPIPTLDGLAQVAERYDLLLCDVWGVLHDGQKAHVPAGEALIRFRGLPGARPRRVVLVSNAPRPGDGVGRILDRFGVPCEAYDAILTSGDLTRELIAGRPGARRAAPPPGPGGAPRGARGGGGGGGRARGERADKRREK